MKNESSLTEEARDQIEEMGKADILVGIPSFNNEKSVGHVVRAVQFGLAKDIWGTDVARYGIDVWMTTTALTPIRQ